MFSPVTDVCCCSLLFRHLQPGRLDVNQHLIDEPRTVVLAHGTFGDSVEAHGFGNDDRTFLEVNFASGDATAPGESIVCLTTEVASPVECRPTRSTSNISNLFIWNF